MRYRQSRLVPLFLCVLLTVSAVVSAETVRKPVWAGRFYPESPQALQQMISDYSLQAKQDAGTFSAGKTLRAVVFPHAGYVYSGLTAGHTALALEGKRFEKVLLLGPDHRVGFRNGAVSAAAFFETPLGKVKIHRDALRLREDHPDLFRAVPASDRQEHSLEVVVPFLQHSLGTFELIPIVLGNPSDIGLIQAALAPLIDASTLVVVSSDLSHYLPYDQARTKDRGTIRLITGLKDEDLLARDNAACGAVPLAVLIKLAKQNGWQPTHLNYTNSGDAAGSKDRVVGYASIAFYGDTSMVQKKKTTNSVKKLTQKQGMALVSLARQTIGERFGYELEAEHLEAMEKTLKEKNLQAHRGIFVTLHKDGKLRGCIGTLKAEESLVEGAKRNALNAAFHDYRFSSLEDGEQDEVEIEVSVLTEPQLLKYKDGQDLLSKLKPKIDGVIVRKGAARATYLPQVWDQLPLPEDFLSQLCMKAGLPNDAWSTMKLEVLTYQVQYFEEKK